METNRRDFLKDAAWMGAAATLTGCAMANSRPVGANSPAGASMMGFRTKPMERIRVGVIGLGQRGGSAIKRLSQIPVLDIVALCDIMPDRVEKAAKHLVEKGHPAPKRFTGTEDWKRVCELPEVDVVYCCTHWLLHAPVCLQAMNAGKIPFTEVPGALTVEDCWNLVETSERTRIPCMMLENACYSEYGLAVYMMQKAGLFGEMVYADVGYLHDLRKKMYTKVADGASPQGYWNFWRLRWNKDHAGDAYPTHQLGAPAKYFFNLNAGDRMDYLVSMSSKCACPEAYAKTAFPADDWRAKLKVKMGDLSVALIKTIKEKMIVLQHSVVSPRPYTRGVVVGTKGTLSLFYNGTKNVGLCIEKTPGEDFEGYMPEEERNRYLEKYAHPLWRKEFKTLAKKVGGHGGVDILMDLRWSYCLATGQPLDMNVYDLASWSSLVELTERSEQNHGRSVDIPDFTRGAWEKATPPDPEKMTVDLARLGFGDDTKKKLSGAGQMKV